MWVIAIMGEKKEMEEGMKRRALLINTYLRTDGRFILPKILSYDIYRLEIYSSNDLDINRHNCNYGSDQSTNTNTSKKQERKYNCQITA